MPTDYQKEVQFFDAVASSSKVEVMSRKVLNRYAYPKHPHLFGKEMMFHLAGDLAGKNVLEVGCGEGVASAQLSYCGACVDGIDISPVSIEVAKRRCAVNALPARFLAADFVSDYEPIPEVYDIVWCDLILHHLTDSLDIVMSKIHASLKPGGLFIAREPIAYAVWLKNLRRRIPVDVDFTEDEQPFRDVEFSAVKKYFSGLHLRHFRILARADRVTQNLAVIRGLARMDNFLLKIPGTRPLAGNVVMWAQK